MHCAAKSVLFGVVNALQARLQLCLSKDGANLCLWAVEGVQRASTNLVACSASLPPKSQKVKHLLLPLHQI